MKDAPFKKKGLLQQYVNNCTVPITVQFMIQEIERLSKQSSNFALQKEKIEIQLDRAKLDLLQMKQNKVVEHPEGIKIHLMMKCIRKQAALIQNLDNQISCLEQMNSKSLEHTRTLDM